jgi:hypothetical protein
MASVLSGLPCWSTNSICFSHHSCRREGRSPSETLDASTSGLP